MARFSIRRILALTAYCAVAAVVVANPMFGTTPWRIPVWIGPAAIFCLPLFAWFVLLGSRRHWVRFAQAVGFAIGGMVLGFLFFESPLPGALLGLLSVGLLIGVLSGTHEESRRKVVTGFGLVIGIGVVLCVALTWRHHVAKYAIRRAGGSVSWQPEILSMMPSRTKTVATALGPYLAPSRTFVSFRDSSRMSHRVAFPFPNLSLKRLRPHLESIHGLDLLYVSFQGFGNDDAKQLVGLTTLTGLKLTYTELVDITPLTGLTSLEDLSLQGSPVSDLTPLAGLTGLQRLGLNRTHVRDVKPLAGLIRLQELYLASTPVSDVTPLAGLTRLDVLWLQDTQVSDVTGLAGLTNLQRLKLSNTQVANVAALSGLVNLRQLDLQGSRVSTEEVNLLKQALPKCRIKY